MRGDPQVSPMHCLEEDDEDSGGVSEGAPSPPHPLLPEGRGPRARSYQEPQSGGIGKVSFERCHLGTKNLGPHFHLPITSERAFPA